MEGTIGCLVPTRQPGSLKISFDPPGLIRGSTKVSCSSAGPLAHLCTCSIATACTMHLASALQHHDAFVRLMYCFNILVFMLSRMVPNSLAVAIAPFIPSCGIQVGHINST